MKTVRGRFLMLRVLLTSAACLCLCKLESARTAEQSDGSIGQQRALPNSNQDLFDRPNSSVYFSLIRTSVAPVTWSKSNYAALLGQNDKTHFDLDLLTQLTKFTNSSVWLDYGVGFLTASGSVYDRAHATNLNAEVASLVVIPIRFAVHYQYEYTRHLHPFLGAHFTEFLYRLSSSTSAIEQQGDFNTAGPVAGIKLASLGSFNGSLIAELIYERFLNRIENGNEGMSYLAGLGWSF